jgi:predicted RNA-binding protein associated with RNAse of E/G family
MRWIKERFPSLSKDVDELWGAYGALGYEGIDGERAEKAVAAMERVLDEIEREAHVRFK